MSATAPELVQRAQDVVERLSAAIHAGGSGANLQLICSELFEAIQAELKLVAVGEGSKKELLSSALDLCIRVGDPTLKAHQRLAQLRGLVALLHGGDACAPTAVREVPRFRVIQGGIA